MCQVRPSGTARGGAVVGDKAWCFLRPQAAWTASDREQDLGGGALVHCLVALGCPVERQGEVEDLAGGGCAVADQLDQLGQELPYRGGAAVEVTARPEQLIAGDGVVVGHTPDPDMAAGTGRVN